MDAIVGTLIGSGITLLATYLAHYFSEKREIRRAKEKREEEAISQVYSPLVFVLDETRSLFAKILATQETLKRTANKENRYRTAIFIINYLTARHGEIHSKVLQDLLMHKSGLIESKEFYFDLLMFQSYLSTLVSFLGMLISRSFENASQLRQYITSLGPLIKMLDEAISKMRKYSIAKVSRQTVKYKQFFTKQKYLELESYIDEASKVIVGKEVIDWRALMKQLR